MSPRLTGTPGANPDTELLGVKSGKPSDGGRDPDAVLDRIASLQDRDPDTVLHRIASLQGTDPRAVLDRIASLQNLLEAWKGSAPN